MIGLMARLKVKDGHAAAFKAAFRTLAARVKADEPGNVLYQLTRSRADPNEYVVMELYRDQAAVDAMRRALDLRIAARDGREVHHVHHPHHAEDDDDLDDWEDNDDERG